MASSSGAPLVEGSTLGRYTITRMLGQGGMGIVYEAVHRELGKRVAIKTLLPHHAISSDVRARFIREGQAAARIRHPHVVDVYDVATEGEMPYLVMEFLEGEDVAKLVAREGALPVQRAVELLLPAISAVAMANELGVVHRDLKPENVFLCVERGVIRPRVVDFGISKLVDKDGTSALTATDAFLGTPFYMSPEQAQGAKNVDSRSDQYSLGVILYECVTGRRPFDDPTLYKLMHKIVTGDFPHPRALVAELPEDFEAVILKAMAKDPAARFESTRAFGSALLGFAGERARAVLWDDFAGEARTVRERSQDSSGADASPDPDGEPPRASTLGRSVQEIDARARGLSRRRFGTLALVAGLAASVLLWLGTRSGLHSVAPNPPNPAASAPGPSGVAAPPSISVVPSEPASPVPPTSSKKLLQTVPPGASVLVDGQELGPTPRTLEVPEGGLEVELRRDGYESTKRRITADEPAELSVTLPRRSGKQKGAPTAAGVSHPSHGAASDIPSLAPR